MQVGFVETEAGDVLKPIKGELKSGTNTGFLSVLTTIISNNYLKPEPGPGSYLVDTSLLAAEEYLMGDEQSQNTKPVSADDPQLIIAGGATNPAYVLMDIAVQPVVEQKYNDLTVAFSSGNKTLLKFEGNRAVAVPDLEEADSDMLCDSKILPAEPEMSTIEPIKESIGFALPVASTANPLEQGSSVKVPVQTDIVPELPVVSELNNEVDISVLRPEFSGINGVNEDENSLNSLSVSMDPANVVDGDINFDNQTLPGMIRQISVKNTGFMAPVEQPPETLQTGIGLFSVLPEQYALEEEPASFFSPLMPPALFNNGGNRDKNSLTPAEIRAEKQPFSVQTANLSFLFPTQTVLPDDKISVSGVVDNADYFPEIQTLSYITGQIPLEETTLPSVLKDNRKITIPTALFYVTGGEDDGQAVKTSCGAVAYGKSSDCNDTAATPFVSVVEIPEKAKAQADDAFSVKDGLPVRTVSESKLPAELKVERVAVPNSWSQDVLSGIATLPAQEAGGSFSSSPVQLNSVVSVIRQVMSGSDFTNFTNRTNIRLKLEPENLGELRISLTYSHGKLTADFYTVSHAAKETVEALFPQLRDSLAGANIRLENAEVHLSRGEGFLTGDSFMGYHEPGGRQTTPGSFYASEDVFPVMPENGRDANISKSIVDRLV